MLTDETLARFLTSHPTRSYSLIFFDAIHLHNKPELDLQSLHSDFTLVAHSFISNNNPNNKLFFCDIEFKHSQSSFSLFSVNSLPHIRLVAPHHQTPKHSHPMDQAHFSRFLDSLPDFVQSHTDLFVGPIDRPPAISTRQLILIFLLALFSSPFLLKRVLEGDTLLHEPLLWMTLSEDAHIYGGPKRSVQARELISVSGSSVKESIELESISSSKPISSFSGSSVEESISRGADGVYPPESSTSVGSRIVGGGGPNSTGILVTQLGEIRSPLSIGKVALIYGMPDPNLIPLKHVKNYENLIIPQSQYLSEG
ncbi:hypothetical protein Sjap_002040 [Stephania japonica]|uniref:Uncharacterized protein n=1 Tax=Stephania japonica TaxID=461633 RepID=A0AAP0KNP4_9MAGN